MSSESRYHNNGIVNKAGRDASGEVSQQSIILAALADAVVCMDEEASAALSRQALAEGIPAEKALDQGLALGMERAGELFDRGEYFVPEVVVCADALYAGLEVLRPALLKVTRPKGRVVIGVVAGDTHDIGKNLVAMMLNAAGFEIHDLGRNVPTHLFISQALDVDADIVALSALVTTTMQNMPLVINQLREASVDRYRYVIVGGAPVSQSFADRIGADGYAENAPAAVRLARRLIDREARP